MDAEAGHGDGKLYYSKGVLLFYPDKYVDSYIAEGPRRTNVKGRIRLRNPETDETADVIVFYRNEAQLSL